MTDTYLQGPQPGKRTPIFRDPGKRTPIFRGHFHVYFNRFWLLPGYMQYRSDLKNSWHLNNHIFNVLQA